MSEDMDMKDKFRLAEQLTRYLGGVCSDAEARELSARLERDPAACDLLAEIAMQSAAVREFAQANPVPVRHVKTMSPRWQIWLSPLAAAAAIVCAAVIWWQNSHDDAWVMRSAEVSGNVRWTGQRGAVVDILASDTPLGGGTVETVSDDAAVTMVFRDGSLVTLMAHSAATISDDGRKRVHLRRGNLSADVEPQPDGRPMLVYTPTAEISVLGTRFDVEAGEAATRLNVDEGTVRMTRLLDSSSVEVSAAHQAVATLSLKDRFAAVQRVDPVVAWSSDLTNGSKDVDGEWLPAEGEIPARLRATPKLTKSPRRGLITIHRVNFRIPWEGLETLQIKPDSRLRLRGRMSESMLVEIMLSTRQMRGGFAGNYFHRITPPASSTNANGDWQMEVPLSAFRKERADGDEAPREGLRLNNITIYTIDVDAGLEIQQIEVLHPTTP